MASTILLATSDSDAAKKPRLRLMARRSSAVRPLGDFHRAMSACMEISVGIQWLLQPARYFSHAHRYLSGSSWLTSARQLIMALSSTRTRAAPRAIPARPVGSGPAMSTIEGCVRTRTEGASAGSSQVSMRVSFLELVARCLRASYWQASQVGSSMEHCFGAAPTATALSLPSVRCMVDFSTCVAEDERR